MKRKYRLLYFSMKRRAAFPIGLSREVTELVLEVEWRYFNFGCIKIAEQLGETVAIPINKDVVRRILATNAQPVRHDCFSLST